MSLYSTSDSISGGAQSSEDIPLASKCSNPAHLISASISWVRASHMTPCNPKEYICQVVQSNHTPGSQQVRHVGEQH